MLAIQETKHVAGHLLLKPEEHVLPRLGSDQELSLSPCASVSRRDIILPCSNTGKVRLLFPDSKEELLKGLHYQGPKARLADALLRTRPRRKDNFVTVSA